MKPSTAMLAVLKCMVKLVVECFVPDDEDSVLVFRCEGVADRGKALLCGEVYIDE